MVVHESEKSRCSKDREQDVSKSRARRGEIRRWASPCARDSSAAFALVHARVGLPTLEKARAQLCGELK